MKDIVGVKIYFEGYCKKMITFDGWWYQNFAPFGILRNSGKEPSNNPNYDSIARLLSFHQLFQEIRIVTTRFCRIEIVDFIEKYQLPISAIHCTIRRT